MLCCYLCVKRNLLYVYIVIIGNFQPIRYKIIFNTRICLNNVSTFTTYVQVVNLCICWDTCWSVTNGKSVRSIKRTKGQLVVSCGNKYFHIGVFQEKNLPSALWECRLKLMTPWISSQIYCDPPGIFQFFALTP